MHSVSLKFLVGILSFSDYYPFGMQMPGRNGGEDYRYAFNGMEYDPEVSGDGNSYTTEFRGYDPRLGKWKSLDPLMISFPYASPYVGFANNPVFYVDPNGLAAINPTDPPKGLIVGLTENKDKQEDAVNSAAENTNWTFKGALNWKEANKHIQDFVQQNTNSDGVVDPNLSIVIRTHGGYTDDEPTGTLVIATEQGKVLLSGSDISSFLQLQRNSEEGVEFNAEYVKKVGMDFQDDNALKVDILFDLKAAGMSLGSSGSCLFSACGAGQGEAGFNLGSGMNSLMGGTSSPTLYFNGDLSSSFYTGGYQTSRNGVVIDRVVGDAILDILMTRRGTLANNYKYGWLVIPGQGNATRGGSAQLNSQGKPITIVNPPYNTYQIINKIVKKRNAG
jgi:RHS repeat-associated protein